MEKIWLKEYGDVIPTEINPDHYPSVMAVFEESVEKYADKTAFINMGHAITFKELDTLSKQFAAYLQQSGLERGSTVALMVPNLLQFPIAMFGILRAGMVVVNVNPLYTSRELKHQLNDAKSRTIVIVDNFASTLADIIHETEVENVLLTQMGDMFSPVKGWLVNSVVKYVKKLVPPFELPMATRFKDALKIGAKSQYSPVELTGDDLAFLQYTGGTTGVSKGAMLTHRNMVSNLEQVYGHISAIVDEGKDLVVTPLPLYHIFALLANCLLFIKLGCPNLLITNPRDMKAFIKELNKHPFAIMPGVNTLFNGLLNSPGFADLDFSHFKLGLGGGMAVQASVAEQWQKVTGTVLLEGYGLTECSPVVAVNPPDLPEYKGSIGLPLPSTDIKLVDSEGNEVPFGSPGELLVKGPQVMKGYWCNQEATDQVMQDGWLATGDIATIDEQGYLYIVDRKKDMILVSGFNVFPNEIEEVAVMHEEILEAAAIGVSNGTSGEIVKLFVVPKGDTITPEMVKSHCRKYLTGYKVPKLIEFREELPKTNVGKILRRELREA